MSKLPKTIDYPVKVPKLGGRGMETIVLKIAVKTGMNGEEIIPGEYCAAIDALIIGRRAQIARVKAKAELLAA